MLDAPPNILMVVALEYLDNKLFSERKKGEVRAIMAVSVGDNFNPGFDGQLHYENTEFSFRCYPCVPYQQCLMFQSQGFFHKQQIP